MPDKSKDKYRIPSNRLRGWDYARNGHYYITIVTADHLHAIVILDKSNYYDHIIRDEMEYQYIAEYFVRNPIGHDDAKRPER